MATWLKQSTAVEIKVGPFLDDADGKTAETALTITQSDVRLAKNDGDWAQKSESTSLVHEENGWYRCLLNTTDTNTLGILMVAIAESGALPVWREFMVVPANVYDSVISGSDLLDVNVSQFGNANGTFASGRPEVNTTLIEGSDATNQIRDAVVDDATRIDASALNTLSSHDPGGEIAAAAGIDAVIDDTEDIQSRLPDALTGDGNIKADALRIAGSDAAATNLSLGGLALVAGICSTGSTSTTVTSNLTEATNNHYNGRVITFVTGALAGQTSAITAYNGSTKVLTVTELTEAPGNGDVFLIS